MKTRVPNFRSIASRLIRRMLIGALWCTLIGLALELVWVVHRERMAFDGRVQSVMQTHQPLLVAAVWDIEPAEIQRLLDSITAEPAIRCAVLEVVTGQHFHSCETPDDEGRADALSFDTVINLPNPQAPTSSLGTLRLEFSQTYLYWQMARVAGLLALAAGVLTLVLVGVSHAIVRRELLEPMEKIARFAIDLSPGKVASPLRLDRPGRRRHRDEIDVVGEGFLTLQTEVAGYVETTRRQEAKLAAFAADLEDQVRERTAELRAVGAYLEALSRNSSRFLGVAPDAFPALMRDTLRELAQFCDCSNLALAERRGAEGPLRWRYVWQSATDGVRPLAEGEALPAHLVLPLHAGWNHQHTPELGQASGAHAGALQEQSAQGVYCCAWQGGGASRCLISLSAQPGRLGQINERLTQMSADMMFNALQRHLDQMSLQQMHSELEHLSNTDTLTGLANRRHFDTIKLKETRRALRTATPLSVISIDIDHFKAYNDSYGHAGGDSCLAMVAEAIRATFHREGELPARIGGEEFVVLLPNLPLHEAMALAQRLRQRIVEQQMPHVGSPLTVVTISLGVACLERKPPQAELSAELSAEQAFAAVLKDSDEALYAAKHAGRNRVHQAA